MGKRVVAIVVGLLAAGLPAVAQQSNAPTPVASSAAPKPLQRKTDQPVKPAHSAATPVGTTPAEQTGSVTHRKTKPKTKPKHGDDSALVSSYAAMPETERLAIQADLAWAGDYTGNAGGDFDQHTIDAVKAFQKRHGGKETGILSEQERALLAAAARGPEEAVGWRVIDDPATGTRLGLPEKLVPQNAAAPTGSRWTSGHGQIQIETFRLREAALPALFDEEKRTSRRRSIDFSTLKPDSFVVVGMQGLKKLVVRAQASGTDVRGITILFDQATEGIMGAVAVAVANSFQGFPDPNAELPPGRKRSVEYGTAIVVDRDGDLIASREVTEQCAAITVPGFGHAARIAGDAVHDLALLRLYGARGLVPAALGGDNDTGVDLTLVGIADPAAQDGGGAVTRVAARVTAQGVVDPAPALGFSGAAALDVRGRFAGVVELKSSAVAGTGPATRQAVFVPAEIVRAFLAANGIPPAAGHAAIDQSVVRVICVRK